MLDFIIPLIFVEFSSMNINGTAGGSGDCAEGGGPPARVSPDRGRADHVFVSLGWRVVSGS